MFAFVYMSVRFCLLDWVLPLLVGLRVCCAAYCCVTYCCIVGLVGDCLNYLVFALWFYLELFMFVLLIAVWLCLMP